MAKINLGVIGTGIFAKDAHLPSINSLDSIEIGAAYNRTKAKAEEFAEVAQFDKSQVADTLEELLANPKVDAVDALVPVANNLDTIKKALAAGKPIAIEKPISSNLDDAKEIVKATRGTELPVIILENFCYHEACYKLRELLPKIGKVITFMYQATGPYTKSKYHATSWRRSPDHIGGYLSDGGVHQLAVLTEVLGEVESVSARTTQVQEVAGDVDTLNAQLNMKSGAFGNFTYASYLGACKKTNRFTIWGTNGTLTYDFSPSNEHAFIEFEQGVDGNSESKVETVKLPPRGLNGVDKEFANFAEAIQTKDKSKLLVTPEKAFHHFAIIVASVLSGQKKGELTQVETV